MLTVAKIHFNNIEDVHSEEGSFFQNKGILHFDFEDCHYVLSNTEQDTIMTFIEYGQKDEIPMAPFSDAPLAQRLGEFLSKKFSCYVEICYAWADDFQAKFDENGGHVSFKTPWKWIYYSNGTPCAKR